MVLKRWDELPENMKSESVKPYYDLLYKKRSRLVAKRIFDVIAAVIVFIIILPLFVLLSLAIKIDSKGPILFRQIRVTQYGKRFRIFKFRTMVNNADKIGAQITTENDARVTRIGKFLRKFRLDEIPQLLNIILGDMSFVGTRPEVVKYVEKYTDEMISTLLLPAGVTSEASIRYKDEEKLLLSTSDVDVDDIYINKILPKKMLYNLKSLEEFNFFSDIKTMFRTVVAVIKSDIKKEVINIDIYSPKKRSET